MFVTNNGIGTHRGSTWCFSNFVFPTVAAVVSLPSIVGGFRHYRLLHFNPWSFLLLSFKKSLKFSLAYPKNFFPCIGSNSSLVLSGNAAKHLTEQLVKFFGHSSKSHAFWHWETLIHYRHCAPYINCLKVYCYRLLHFKSHRRVY